MLRSSVFLSLASLALAVTARPASAQTALAAPVEQSPPPAEAMSRAARPLFAFDFAGQAPVAAPQSPLASDWKTERRACDGCPPRSVGHAFFDTTIVNVFYEIANLARGQVTAHISPKSWWANMEQGWVWDLDDFGVNQVGHPYQGNNYYNAGRANGLSFWESAGITAFGSGTWEYYGETNHASVNDLINTTLGGIALGEMFHRAAWLVRDTRLSGKPRLWKEIGAMAIDPITGLKRFMSGDASRISEKPPEMIPSALQAVGSLGVLSRGSNTNAFEGDNKGFLELNMLYGDPRVGRSRTPYDDFTVLLRFGGGGGLSEAKVRGRLLGQPFLDNRIQFNVTQAYDFAKNNVYQFGAQAFNGNVAYTMGSLSDGLALWAMGWGGLTALGAVDSIPLEGIDACVAPAPEDGAGQGVSEGPRCYDYGPGTDFGARAILTHSGRPIVDFLYETHHLYSLDGVRANHFLQQLRLDLLAPVKGPLGVGFSAEYFDRRTYFSQTLNPTQKFHYPQVRLFMTWRFS
ncbi:MAG TPA: DUF3943 domain-containing protein [Pseudolysinimonas sp.]|jgi:hypothetical protein|nr:DUF3943 domain-containing protein [Pseudolysinimonas sp.]